MARSFNGTTDLISNSGSLPTYVVSNGSSLTLVAWAAPASLSIAGGWDIFGIGSVGALTGTAFRLRVVGNGSSANANWDVRNGNTGDSFTNSATSFTTANVWHHFAATLTATGTGAGSGIVYLDGGGLQTNSWNGITATGFAIGALGLSGGPFNPYSGSIAHCAAWNVALSTAEIAALAAGVLPGLIRPQNLIGWWPLDGLQSPEPDLSGNANNGTLTGTALAPGPPVMQFTPRWPQFLKTAAAALGIAVWPFGMSGSGFNPASLVGTLGGFWRADIGVTSSGGTVSAWADQSPNSNNLSVLTTPIAQVAPTWSSTAFNSAKPGVNFSGNASCGVGQTTSVFNSNSLTTVSIFALWFDLGSSPNNARMIWDYDPGGANDFSQPAFVMQQGTGSVDFSTFCSGITGNGGSGVSFTTGTPVSSAIIFDGTNGNAYKNFTVQGAARSFTSTLGGTAHNFGFGASPSGSTADFVLAWVLATNNVLAAGDILNLKTWCNANWGTSF